MRACLALLGRLLLLGLLLLLLLLWLLGPLWGRHLLLHGWLLHGVLGWWLQDISFAGQCSQMSCRM